MVSIDNDRVLVVFNVVIAASLPEVHFIINGLLLSHLVKALDQPLQKSWMVGSIGREGIPEVALCCKHV